MNVPPFVEWVTDMIIIPLNVPVEKCARFHTVNNRQFHPMVNRVVRYTWNRWKAILKNQAELERCEMDMIWQISVGVVALAFVVLVIFLVRTLATLQKSLTEINHTLTEVREDLNGVSTEVKGLIRNTNQITLDVRTKMKSLDSVFETVDNVGATLEVVTSTVRNASTRYLTGVNQNMNKVEQTGDKKAYKIINTVSSIYDIWQRIKLHRMNKEQNKNAAL